MQSFKEKFELKSAIFGLQFCECANFTSFEFLSLFSGGLSLDGCSVVGFRSIRIDIRQSLRDLILVSTILLSSYS